MLVRAVISAALRKLGRLGGGREPKVADQTDTLEALQGLYRSWIASGAMGRLVDIVPLSSIVAPPNSRILRCSDAVENITLPSLVQGYCWRWNCNDQVYQQHAYCDAILDLTYYPTFADATTPRDASVVTISDQCAGTTTDFIYDGSTKQWQAIHGLTLDSEAPRSFADPQGLAASLALEVADIFGADVPPTLIRQAARYQTALTSRFSMPRVETTGEYF